MTKQELVNAIATDANLSKKDAGNSLDAAIAAITKAMQAGEKVQLVGFGTFEVRDRAAREGKNPQTGAKISIAATKAPAFKAGKALKEAVAK